MNDDHPEIDDPTNGQHESPAAPPPLAEKAITGKSIPNNLGDQLQAIAQAAQTAPAGSPQRNRQLNRLISLVQRFGKLSRPPLRHLENHPTLYQEIYEEACQRTWDWLSRAIEQYDPKKASVSTWINNHLKWRIKDVEGEMIDYACHNLGESNREDWINLVDQPSAPDLHDPHLESDLELHQAYRDSVELYLASDPDQLLAQTMKSRPDISLKQVVAAKSRGEKMTNIARSLAVNNQSLVRFFNDRRDKLYASIQAFHEQRL